MQLKQNIKRMFTCPIQCCKFVASSDGKAFKDADLTASLQQLVKLLTVACFLEFLHKNYK